MSTIERLDAPISERPSPDTTIDAPAIKNNVIALYQLSAGSSFFWATQLY